MNDGTQFMNRRSVMFYAAFNWLNLLFENFSLAYGSVILNSFSALGLYSKVEIAVQHDYRAENTQYPTRLHDSDAII